MKAALCFAVLAACVAGVAMADEFDVYKQQFNKVYAAKQDEMVARHNFAATLNRIKTKTEEARAAGLNTQFAVNKFSDMSADEFRSTFASGNRNNRVNPKIRSAYEPADVADLAALGIPQNYDWATTACVSPVKNQEQCGSCWAFSATEGSESAWQLAKGGQVPILAPQQIVDCDTNDGGCNGGDLPTAFQYIQGAGLETESAYPYVGSDQNCAYASSSVVVTISGFQYATQSENETQMLVSSYSNGPLSICVDASSWQDYSGGVIQPGCGQSLDHCVQLTGWGTTTDGNNTPYWIVRNSWSTDWGLNGYVWVERNSDVCGIAQEATYVTI